MWWENGHEIESKTSYIVVHQSSLLLLRTESRVNAKRKEQLSDSEVTAAVHAIVLMNIS